MAEMHTRPDGAAEPIAIIGMSCRYPGARNLAEFWTLLHDGVDAVSEIPPERWDVDAYYDPDPSSAGKMLTRWGGFIDAIDTFDARFFNISPREANHMDPQQRKLLEVASEALEHAGQPLDQIAGTRGGVFVATLGHDYDEYMFDDYSNIDAYIGTGNAHCVAANRLSYVFDLHGPSVAVDTACSGSLVAIHMACQSLRSGESTIALAGGVNVILLPKFNIFFSKAGATAPDGRCKTFSAEANGIVRSEGVGMLVLKRFSQALADGDTIHALIMGSAVNSDGRSNGLMAPNQQAQEALLREAYRSAGIDPAAVQYVEAHGTGTPLGDPIEIRALGAVLGANRPAGSYCAVGSVKSNIGHTEAAAGVAGVIKAVLAIRNRQIPPSLHAANLNPRIPFDDLPIRVQRSPGAWPDPTRPAIAGVSAFGIGGTNAHIVLHEPPQPQPSDAAAGAHLLTLSAKNKPALEALARSYEQLFASDTRFPAICAAAASRRTHHDQRLALVARNADDARQQLGAFLNGDARARMSSGKRAWDTAGKLAFVFSGQGSHWLGMGRDLLDEPIFREQIVACDQLISALAGWSLIAELEADADRSRLSESAVMQPAIFAIQVALAALWRSWGIEPAAVVGQSLGEVAAAHVAGALSLEDAVRVVVLRSELMQRTAGKGRTAVVDLPFEQAQFTLAGSDDLLSIAGSSSPTSSVLSGDPEALERVLKFIERRNIFCRMLPDIDIAFHSPQMEPLRGELVGALATITPHAASMPIYSTVVARRQEGEAFDAAYWGANLREPFLFSTTFQTMLADGYTTFIEISPHPVMLKPMQDGAGHAGRTIQALPSLRRNETARETLLGTLGALHVQGFTVRWNVLYPNTANCAELPSYPWQRERFWYSKTNIAPRTMLAEAPTATRRGTHPLLGPLLRSALPQGQFFWERNLSSTDPGYLSDHRVQGIVVVPGAAYVEMALAAAEQVFGAGHATIENLQLKQAFFLPETGARTVQLVVTPETSTTATFQILSAPADAERPNWLLHAAGTIQHTNEAPSAPAPFGLAEIQGRCTEQIEGAVHYHRMQAYLGLHYGPAFQSVERIWRRDGEVLCALRLPELLEAEATRYRVHPSFLDAAFQVVTATLPMHEGTATGDHTFLPVGLKCVRVYGTLDQQLWCHVVLRSAVDLQADAHHADIYLLDQQGRVVVEALGLLLHPISGHAANERTPAELLYTLAWHSAPRGMPVAPSGERWLILADSDGRGAALANALQARGGQATIIQQPGQLATTLTGGTFQQIVHLWGLDAANPENTTADSLAHAEMGIVTLVQALAKQRHTQPARLTLVTQNAQAVGGPAVVPNQASLWGIGRVAAREHPELRVRLLDLDQQTHAEELLAELCAADEAEIALRGTERLTPRLERFSTPDTSTPISLRADGSYLITGGLGGIGLSIARWMVERGARRLILIGRTTLPPRSSWNQPITDSKLAASVAAVRELEALGVSVHLAAFDIADQHAAARFFETYRNEGWPSIRGVVHAAGVLDDQLLLNMTEASMQRVMRTKVLGSWVLHHLLQEEPLDLFVLCSSMAALFGSIGQGNYAAGNAFMDALAHQRRHNGLPALSVNWGPWAEVGMAAGEELAARLATQGITPMPPAQALGALERLLQSPINQAAVLGADWSHWPDSGGLASELVAAAQTERDDAPIERATFVHDVLMAAPAEEWPELLETHLQQLVGRVLELDPTQIDLQQPLNTIGLDSIMALELKTAIERDLGLSVPLVAILQGPSINEFAARFLPEIQENATAMEQLLAELEALSSEEVQALLDADQIAIEGV